MSKWAQNEIAINWNTETILTFLFIFKDFPMFLSNYALDTINSRFCIPDSKEFGKKIQKEVWGFCVTH